MNRVSVVLLGLYLVVFNHEWCRAQNLASLTATRAWCCLSVFGWVSVGQCLWRLLHQQGSCGLSSKLKCCWIWKNLGKWKIDFSLSSLSSLSCSWENCNYWKGCGGLRLGMLWRVSEHQFGNRVLIRCSSKTHQHNWALCIVGYWYLLSLRNAGLICHWASPVQSPLMSLCY